MDEQRLQAYQQLIQQLLSCPNGEEAAILAANTELLDVGFLQMVVGVAGMFTQEGQENTANWLLALASQLSEELDITLDGNTPEPETPLNEADIDTYLPFLLEVLQATAESKGNPQVVYPLLTANTDKLNLTFAQLLQAWTTKILAEAEAELDKAQFFALLIGEFSNLINEFPLGNKADNIEIAITGNEIALTFFTRNISPEIWASVQNNLGTAYCDRIRGDKPENLEKAITAFSAALEVRTRTDFPQKNAETLLNLGIAYQESQQFDLAYSTFSDAITTVEDIRGEIISGEESKRKQAEEWNKLFRRMVEVCLALGKETEAITYIERSKTRNLVEQILNRELKTIFPGEVVTQLEQLRDEIASGQNLLQTGKAENSTSLAQHLQQLRQQRQQLQDRYLPIGSSFEFASLQNIVDNKTAIIEWYITSDKIIAFVIQAGGKEIKIWQSSSEDREALRDWINEYLTDYYNQKDQWQNQLEESLQNLAVILHIEEILQKIPPQCQKLILIPHRYLHLLPLHALPVRNSYLMDLFPQGVGYAPSLQVLQQVQLRQRPNFQSLFAIQNPNPKDKLFYADLEIESIKQYFSSQKTIVLRGKEADRNALDSRIANLAEANCLHFSCHGSFNLETPADSCLLLNGADVDEEIDLNKCLTLGDLFNKEFNLNQCRLVVLSACETGMIDFNNVSDEYIGLPSGFLYAGSSSVVSSLWKVDDVSTAFLFIKFYENLQNYPELKQGDIAIALNEALIWLRNMTSEEGEEVLPEIQPYIDVMFKEKKDILKTSFLNGAKRRIKSNPQPFANPFHWAAFTAIGY
jgi:CHAT domain-containing protein